MESEKRLVKRVKSTWLFSEEILDALDIGFARNAMQDTYSLKLKSARILNKDFGLNVGEGWVPVINTFTECVDILLSPVVIEVEGSPIQESPIEIHSVYERNGRLNFGISTNNLSVDEINQLEYLRIFAATASAQFCKICGAIAIRNENKSLCRICELRDNFSRPF